MSDFLVRALAVAGGVLALVIGVWLGMPGRYQQSPEDIERIMAEGGARPRKVKRHFTPLAWLQRQASARSARRQGPGRSKGFSVESPDDR